MIESPALLVAAPSRSQLLYCPWNTCPTLSIRLPQYPHLEPTYVMADVKATEAWSERTTLLRCGRAAHSSWPSSCAPSDRRAGAEYDAKFLHHACWRDCNTAAELCVSWLPGVSEDPTSVVSVCQERADMGEGLWVWRQRESDGTDWAARDFRVWWSGRSGMPAGQATESRHLPS